MLELVVPGILAGVACYGMAKGVDVYDALLVGAGKGLEILLKILPALVTLLTVVAMLRASGGLEVLADVLAPVLGWLGIPPETVGLMLVRPISGSAALGVGSELISTYGPDSTIGRTAAVMLGSTETTFYTIAVYFGAEEPLRSPGGAVCGRGGVLFCGVDSSTIYEIKSDNVDKFPLRNGQKPAGALQGNRQKGEPQIIHKLTLEDLKLP